MNEAKEQRGGFVVTILGTLGASLWGTPLTGKSTIRAGQDFEQNLKYKSIFKTNPNLMVFIQEIIYLK